MIKSQVKLILFSLTIFLSFVIYNYLISIYEVSVEINPKHIYADFKTIVTVQVVPVNALGFKAIFRSTTSRFVIIEGNQLVEIIESNSKVSRLKLKTKGLTGTVGIKIYSEHALFPQFVEIEISPLRV